jgi:hypothetical protein
VVLLLAPTGRPKRYCSSRCRQAARRRRSICEGMTVGPAAGEQELPLMLDRCPLCGHVEIPEG